MLNPCFSTMDLFYSRLIDELREAKKTLTKRSISVTTFLSLHFYRCISITTSLSLHFYRFGTEASSSEASVGTSGDRSINCDASEGKPQ